MSNPNEIQRITRILNGDSELYGELIDRYKTGLYYHCFTIICDEDAAEDIAQETFITAYRNLKKYDQKHAFSTWLYKIATRKAIDHLRKRRTVPLQEQTLATITSTQPGPDRSAVYREMQDAVNNLRPKYRSAINLYYWQGKSYDDIATIMGTSVSSIKVWLHRAKQQLKKELS
ncbi:MAG TPA: RNA polymerase sigma factor [Candidatus Saccharimonas sp.]|nr:RNA polymerase sigma factor [Candidatus Saccharimonas sp.]